MASSWGDVNYESLGALYSKQRCADPRIAAHIHRALGQARTVLNIGAGAGSYEPTDRHVIAVEPSPAMRAQRPPGAVPAIIATAEQLPLDDASVDASMAILTVHQWSDLRRGLGELRRVTRGPIIIMTFDAQLNDRWWIREYCPELLQAGRRRDTSIDTLRAILGEIEVRPVPIPRDCTDGFSEAFFARPERFLDDAVRRAQSTWGFIAPGAEERFVQRLRADLDSGEWDRRHGHWRERQWFEGSLILIIQHSRPAAD